MNIVALIPARAGSKRISGKNTRLLAGHPLIAYTIAAAQESGIFARIWVSSDSPAILDTAYLYGANVVYRPPVYAADHSPDIEWVRHALVACALAYDGGVMGRDADAFAILRPTSPFRSAEMIRDAVDKFRRTEGDSLRAVRRVREHPCKVWRCQSSERMTPILHGANEYPAPAFIVPWHSSPTQALPSFYVQTGALEIARTRVVSETGTIAGDHIIPYISEGPEALDLNTESDWREAERLIASGEATLPSVSVARVQAAPTPQ